MALPIVDVFERWFSKKSHNHKNRMAILVLAGLIFVLLATMTSFAVLAFEQPFDGDDIPMLEMGMVIWYAKLLFFGTIFVSFALSIFFIFSRLEYLSAHIGEKRLSGHTMLGVGKFLFPQIYSGRHYSLVSSFFVSCPLAPASDLGLVFVRDPSHDLVPREFIPILSEEVRIDARDY